MTVTTGRTSYFHYFSYGAQEYIDSLLMRIRRESFELFMRYAKPSSIDLILDVGVSADDHPAANYLEKHYPYTHNLTALSHEAFPELELQFPGLTFKQADGRNLPYADGSFDWVYSHAVIEHVGSRRNQRQFVTELLRVARKGVYFTTPNRWHPFESHTGLPLLHFLPAGIYRPVFKLVGKDMYCTEAQLNLLSMREVREMIAEQAALTNYRIDTIRWLQIPSNIVAVVWK